MSKTTTKTLAASIRETLEDGSYETITATDRVAIIRIGHGNTERRIAQANAAHTLRSAGINAHILYRSTHGWAIKATVWA